MEKAPSLSLIAFNNFSASSKNTEAGMGHRTKRILRIERKEYQTY